MKTVYSKFSKTLTKCLALTVLAIGGVTATADAQWRKTWDFSKGVSAETAAKLNADSNWASNRTDADGNTTGWKDAVKLSGILMADGEPIAELNGLDFQTSGLSNGGNFLIDPTSFRMSRTNMAFKLPPVIGGQTITMVAKSANGTATDRGFVGDDNLEYIDGPANGICLGPDGYQTLVWRVKETVTDSTAVQIKCSPAGGLDIQLIMIDKGDGPAVEGPKSIAYITGETDFDDVESIFNGSSDLFDITPIPSTATDVTLDSLQAFQAVIVSPFVGETDALVPVLRKAVAYEPMLNFNANLVKGWGLVADVKTATGTLTIPEGVDAAELLGEISAAEGLALFNSDVTNALVLGDYFANDAIIALAGEDVAIHQHNATRNSYMYVPFALDFNPEIYGTIVVNAANIVAETKTNVTAAGAPTISIDYKDKVSVVNITVSNKQSVIYYTLDGTEPTTESSKFEAPFNLTEAATVKAMAALDGYDNSKVVDKEVAIKNQAAAPKIDINKKADSTIVTLSCATEGVDIYYNYDGNQKADISQKYTQPIELTQEPTIIYAFAVGGDYVQSYLANDYVSINSLNANTIRMDTVSHFSAGEAAWMPTDDRMDPNGTGAASAHYIWGKNAWKYYTDEIDHYEDGKDEEENPIQIPVYKPDAEAFRSLVANDGFGTENDWRLVSYGQVLTGEFQLAPADGVGNGATGRYYETAEDMIGGPASKGVITFGGKGEGEPYSAAIESIKKFPAPFDVVVYCGNGNNGTASTLLIQVSTDGKEWATVDTVKMAATQRYIKKTRASYDNNGEYFVRVAHTAGGTKGQVYDIYVLNNGELSKAYDAEKSGIEEVVAGEAAEVVAVEVYSINGYRVAQPQQGVNIIRTVYADGTVKVEKVIVK